MTKVFTHIDHISPVWLTDCLRTSGVLPYGHVLRLAGRDEATVLSRVGHIAVEYSPDAPPTAPSHIFLKSGSGQDEHNEDWSAEVDFYTRLAAATPSVTVPCYHAAYADEPARFHLLLAHFSTSHTRVSWPLPPTMIQLEQAVDCLADVHSAWWAHPRLGHDIALRCTETSLTAWLSVWEQQLRHFFDLLGDRLLPRRRKLYEWILPRLLSRLLQRRQDSSHYTIAHQDAHPYNFLFPHEARTQTTRLVDWATWDVELGARDLAYLLALHLFPEQRSLVEHVLLRRYHDRLMANGIKNYSWEALWNDYRLFVTWNMFIPIEQSFWNIPSYIWWWHTERSVLAFDDLQCAELFS